MTNKAEKIDSRWDEYHANAAERPTREFLQQILRPRFACSVAGGCWKAWHSQVDIRDDWDAVD